MTNAQPAAIPTDIDRLAYEHASAKAAEDSARKRRLAVEDQILALIETNDEGTSTHTGGYYKISVNTGFTRKITDPQGLAAQLGVELFEMCVRTKYDLNLTGFKKLGEQVKAEATRFIESKPKKPSIKVDELQP